MKGFLKALWSKLKAGVSHTIDYFKALSPAGRHAWLYGSAAIAITYTGIIAPVPAMHYLCTITIIGIAASAWYQNFKLNRKYKRIK
jgi:hypothetical protein